MAPDYRTYSDDDLSITDTRGFSSTGSTTYGGMAQPIDRATDTTPTGWYYSPLYYQQPDSTLQKRVKLYRIKLAKKSSDGIKLKSRLEWKGDKTVFKNRAADVIRKQPGNRKNHKCLVNYLS